MAHIDEWIDVSVNSNATKIWKPVKHMWRSTPNNMILGQSIPPIRTETKNREN